MDRRRNKSPPGRRDDRRDRDRQDYRDRDRDRDRDRQDYRDRDDHRDRADPVRSRPGSLTGAHAKSHHASDSAGRQKGSTRSLGSFKEPATSGGGPFAARRASGPPDTKSASRPKSDIIDKKVAVKAAEPEKKKKKVEDLKQAEVKLKKLDRAVLFEEESEQKPAVAKKPEVKTYSKQHKTVETSSSGKQHKTVEASSSDKQKKSNEAPTSSKQQKPAQADNKVKKSSSGSGSTKIIDKTPTKESGVTTTTREEPTKEPVEERTEEDKSEEILQNMFLSDPLQQMLNLDQHLQQNPQVSTNTVSTENSSSENSTFSPPPQKYVCTMSDSTKIRLKKLRSFRKRTLKAKVKFNGSAARHQNKKFLSYGINNILNIHDTTEDQGNSGIVEQDQTKMVGQPGIRQESIHQQEINQDEEKRQEKFRQDTFSSFPSQHNSSTSSGSESPTSGDSPSPKDTNSPQLCDPTISQEEHEEIGSRVSGANSVDITETVTGKGPKVQTLVQQFERQIKLGAAKQEDKQEIEPHYVPMSSATMTQMGSLDLSQDVSLPVGVGCQFCTDDSARARISFARVEKGENNISVISNLSDPYDNLAGEHKIFQLTATIHQILQFQGSCSDCLERQKTSYINRMLEGFKQTIEKDHGSFVVRHTQEQPSQPVIATQSSGFKADIKLPNSQIEIVLAQPNHEVFIHNKPHTDNGSTNIESHYENIPANESTLI